MDLVLIGAVANYRTHSMKMVARPGGTRAALITEITYARDFIFASLMSQFLKPTCSAFFQ